MIPDRVDAAQIANWRIQGYPYKVVAGAMAEWALKQDRGTVLPEASFFAGNLPIVASESSWTRARTFLATIGVLNGNGPYTVA